MACRLAGLSRSALLKTSMRPLMSRSETPIPRSTSSTVARLEKHQKQSVQRMNRDFEANFLNNDVIGDVSSRTVTVTRSASVTPCACV